MPMMPLIITRRCEESKMSRQPMESAPEFLTRLSSVEANKGGTVKLAVILTGFPEPNVTWTLDDEEVRESDRYVFDWNEEENTHTLSVIHITRREEGVYRCIAKNEHGTCSTMSFVSVKETRSGRRKKKISRTPKISTILEWKSQEEAEKEDCDNDLYLQRNRHTWDWWNREALSDDEETATRRKEDSPPSMKHVESTPQFDSQHNRREHGHHTQPKNNEDTTMNQHVMDQKKHPANPTKSENSQSHVKKGFIALNGVSETNTAPKTNKNLKPFSEKNNNDPIPELKSVVMGKASPLATKKWNKPDSSSATGAGESSNTPSWVKKKQPPNDSTKSSPLPGKKISSIFTKQPETENVAPWVNKQSPSKPATPEPTKRDLLNKTTFGSGNNGKQLPPWVKPKSGIQQSTGKKDSLATPVDKTTKATKLPPAWTQSASTLKSKFEAPSATEKQVSNFIKAKPVSVNSTQKIEKVSKLEETLPKKIDGTKIATQVDNLFTTKTKETPTKPRSPLSKFKTTNFKSVEEKPSLVTTKPSFSSNKQSDLKVKPKSEPADSIAPWMKRSDTKSKVAPPSSMNEKTTTPLLKSSKSSDRSRAEVTPAKGSTTTKTSRASNKPPASPTPLKKHQHMLTLKDLGIEKITENGRTTLRPRDRASSEPRTNLLRKKSSSLTELHGSSLENKYRKLKSFWEVVTTKN